MAALTMPSLIASYQEKEIVTKLKKVYSLFAQVHLQMQEEHGLISTWCTGLTNAECQKKTHDIITPYLKISKDCEFKGGCFNPEKSKNLDGSQHASTSYNVATTQWSTMILADGTSVLLQNQSSSTYVGVYIDINGPKPPQQFGKDLFIISMNDDKVVPSGLPNEEKGNELNQYCSTQAATAGCTAWVVYNENMDYLHCDDLSWNGKTKCD